MIYAKKIFQKINFKNKFILTVDDSETTGKDIPQTSIHESDEAPTDFNSGLGSVPGSS